MKIDISPKALAAAMVLATSVCLQAAPVKGWLHYRGPQQDGTSKETQLPGKLELNGDSHLWTADLAGRSSPTIANGKLYTMGYVGEGPDLREVVACFDANTGSKLWDYRWNDFLSDIIYTRYATSSPTIDPATGNVYVQGSQGVIAGFTADGKKLWEHSMMDRFGRMTFPNGRTASLVIDGNNVIAHHITAFWGADGPARDRFLAFNKLTGDLIWLTTPGGQPKDSSFCPPVLSTWNGQHVVYCGTGDGSVVCFNATTGNPLWFTKISQGGLNSGVLIYKDTIVAIHGRENLDNSEVGRMVGLRIPKSVPAGKGPHIFDVKELEIWRNTLDSFTSTPVLVGDVIYQVSETGDLCAVNAATGEINWKTKLGIEQRTSSLVHADGKLYIPMLEDPEAKEKGVEAGTTAAFYVVKPGPKSGEILSKISLPGRCFGSPTVYNGKIYVQTTKKLFCFGKKGDNPGLKIEDWPVRAAVKPGAPAALHIVPPEIQLQPGQKQAFKIRVVDANGNVIRELADSKGVKWESFIPPTAKVRVRMSAAFNEQGELVARNENKPSAGAFKATYEGLTGVIRGRILPALPFTEDFSSFDVSVTHPAEHPEPGVKFSYPPLPWIGARFKFEIREVAGNKVLTKTIDNKLFQRGIVFFGDQNMSNYTVEADVMTEGNRRKMSEIGLICQRYYVILKGNAGKLQINSNLERIKEETTFRMRPNAWYHLKATVDVNADGSGVVRAKAWEKGETEPAAWTLEVSHKVAHTRGSPGLFGFAPQGVLCHIDNVKVTPKK